MGSIVLVEGESDRAAVRALADRRGVDLERAGVELSVLGSDARRKIRYGRLLVEALEPDLVPRPLDGLLRAALTDCGRGGT